MAKEDNTEETLAALAATFFSAVKTAARDEEWNFMAFRL
jgi:hypothetical protein